MIRALILVALLALTGCASAPPVTDPIVDRPGVNYPADLAECRALGSQAPVVDAGVLLTALNGGAVAKMQQNHVVRMCLVGRGYRVLG